MRRCCKNSKVHTLTGNHRWWHAALLASNAPHPNTQFPVLPSGQPIVKQIRVPSVLLYGGQDTNIWKHNEYLRKTNESPATNLLEVTNVLHPVVSKCLLGWPVNFIICEWWFVFYQPITCAVSLVVQDIANERYQFLSKLENNTSPSQAQMEST